MSSYTQRTLVCVEIFNIHPAWWNCTMYDNRRGDSSTHQQYHRMTERQRAKFNVPHNVTRHLGTKFFQAVNICTSTCCASARTDSGIRSATRLHVIYAFCSWCVYSRVDILHRIHNFNAYYKYKTVIVSRRCRSAKRTTWKAWPPEADLITNEECQSDLRPSGLSLRRQQISMAVICGNGFASSLLHEFYCDEM